MVWKSIKEELPEDRKTVMVYWPPHFRRSIMDYDYVVGGYIGFNSIEMNIRNNGKWRWSKIADFEKYPPTHWMEMPVVPEEYIGVKEKMLKQEEISYKKSKEKE